MAALRSWILICVLILGTAVSYVGQRASGQASAFDRATVLQAIKLAGGPNDVGEVSGTVARVYIAALRSQRPDISDEKLSEISRAIESYVSARAVESDLEGQLVSIYERHLSPRDIDQVVVFFRSEAGQHYSAAMPTILQESADLGKTWTESNNPGIQAVIAKQLGGVR